jgi:signal transduction histidine kinase
MEKETKRTLQRMIEIMQEQHNEIRTLQRKTAPRGSKLDDGLADRIERIAQEVAEQQSFEFDWGRLCDRHYAMKS